MFVEELPAADVGTSSASLSPRMIQKGRRGTNAVALLHATLAAAADATNSGATGAASQRPTSKGTICSARSRPKGRQAPLLDAPENPQKPEKVQKCLEVARGRMDELQDIFTSRHSERRAKLLARLESLATEAATLRSRITALEREQQDINSERLTLEKERINECEPPNDGTRRFETRLSDGWSRASSRANSRANSRASISAGTELLSRLTRSTTPQPCDGDAFDSSAGEPDVTTRVKPPWALEPCDEDLVECLPDSSSPTVPDQRHSAPTIHIELPREDKPPVEPNLKDRQAEARCQAANTAHEDCLNQMKAELQELERRMQKQQNWMKNIDEEVLKAEVQKAAYSVRLHSAECRIASLGAELSKAYDNMGWLLETHQKVGKHAARNDALVAYSDALGHVDAENAANFIENRVELLALMERYQKAHECASRLDGLMEQVQTSQQLVSDVMKRADELHRHGGHLQNFWLAVPSDVKEFVFQRAPQPSRSSTTTSLTALVDDGAISHSRQEKPLTAHPATSAQTLQSTSGYIVSSLKSHARTLADIAPNSEGGRGGPRSSRSMSKGRDRTTKPGRTSGSVAKEQLLPPGVDNRKTSNPVRDGRADPGKANSRRISFASAMK